MENKGQVIGYARVSTTGQHLDSQLAALQQAGAGKIFNEKVSAKTADRPQLRALLDFVRQGDTVVATKLDRLARSTKDLLELVDQLEAQGVSLRVLNIQLDTSTPTGKLMLTMLGAIAQFERELMLERQAEGFAAAKAAGKVTGRPATAKAHASQVQELAAAGTSKADIARQLGIGQASVYRILAAAR